MGRGYAIRGVMWFGESHDITQKQHWVCYSEKGVCGCVTGGGGGVCLKENRNGDYKTTGKKGNVSCDIEQSKTVGGAK